jgi:hypothetical protein
MRGGRGWRHQYYATGLPRWARGYAYPSVDSPGFPTAFAGVPTSNAARREELAYLKGQTQYLKETMDSIESRINELQREDEHTTETRDKK